MLDIATLRKLHDQLNRDAIERAIALYALFEDMSLAEAQHSAKAIVTSRFKARRLAYREVRVSISWLGERCFLIWDRPQVALAKVQEVAA